MKRKLIFSLPVYSAGDSVNLLSSYIYFHNVSMFIADRLAAFPCKNLAADPICAVR